MDLKGASQSRGEWQDATHGRCYNHKTATVVCVSVYMYVCVCDTVCVLVWKVHASNRHLIFTATGTPLSKRIRCDDHSYPPLFSILLSALWLILISKPSLCFSWGHGRVHPVIRQINVPNYETSISCGLGSDERQDVQIRWTGCVECALETQVGYNKWFY